MRCLNCKNSDTKVMESRELDTGEAIRRRRECLNCNFRFTTYERIELPVLIVNKRSGQKEQFSRQKLADGIYKACEKRDIPQNEIEETVSEIEKKLREKGEGEVASIDIGKIALDELSKLDNVSYIRFASVYQSFSDLKNFQEMLDKIENAKENNVNKQQRKFNKN